MRSITALGRPIDPRLASNRYAIIAAALAAVAAGGVAAAAGGDPLGWALRGGLATFLAWAVGRELVPDRPMAAALAAPLGLAALAAGRPSLVAVAAVLLTVRIAVRTTGLWPSRVDLVAMVVLAALAGWQLHGVWAGIGLAGVLALDTRLPRPAPPRSLAGGAIAALAAMAAALVGDGFAGGWALPDAGESVVLGGGVLAVLTLRSRPPRTAGDYTGVALDAVRLRAGRLVAVAVLAATALAGGGAGVAALAPVWAAFAGAALVDLADRVAAAGPS